MANEEDIKVAQQILSILRAQPTIVLSWGVDPASVRTIERGLSFHVSGFKITGTVNITLFRDKFKVEVVPDDEKPKTTHYDITPQNLVSVIDEAVEKTDDYQERVYAEYGITTVPQSC